MADELGLKLTAQVDDWVQSLAKASKSADGLLKTVLELERAVKAAFAGIEAAARAGAGKAAGAFVAAGDGPTRADRATLFERLGHVARVDARRQRTLDPWPGHRKAEL